ncbi:hypothetical protein H5410_003434 [Solanum commersonii]|uniref:Uncharacterized protein n=1 Tax=Solanum commersonii TaxID=4109 RepID=A0A9J6B4N9_SOLCO|nr:hypothetical protein H5410_003434 [Solanum commersonii]
MGKREKNNKDKDRQSHSWFAEWPLRSPKITACYTLNERNWAKYCTHQRHADWIDAGNSVHQMLQNYQ